MKLFSIVVCVILYPCSFCFGQADSLQARIILIGDAGSLKNGKHPVVDAVRNTIQLDSITTVIFLGDNLYPLGLPDDAYPNYTTQKNILDSQISLAANTPAREYFIPGNHDWQHEKPGGWDAIVREQEYVDNAGYENVHFYPKDGCPGPVEISISKAISFHLQ